MEAGFAWPSGLLGGPHWGRSLWVCDTPCPSLRDLPVSSRNISPARSFSLPPAPPALCVLRLGCQLHQRRHAGGLSFKNARLAHGGHLFLHVCTHTHASYISHAELSLFHLPVCSGWGDFASFFLSHLTVNCRDYMLPKCAESLHLSLTLCDPHGP